MSDAPGYWMNETTGVLRPAVCAYLNNETMTPQHIASLRAYFRQWIAHPNWRGPHIERLRRMVDELTTRKHIETWLDFAEQEGIDPL